MSLLELSGQGGSAWTRIGDNYGVTKKPRELDVRSHSTIPFVPMELVPQGGAYEPSFVLKSPDASTSGTYFERGDVLVSKITPSFENGKQALVQSLPLPFGYATTEVIPLRPFDRSQHDPRLLFFYLLHPDVRHYVAERMAGSTGRQRVPERVLLDLPMPEIEPKEQVRVADSLELIQTAIAVEGSAVKSAQELKRATMTHLFTRGLRGEAQKETEIGLVPESWTVNALREVAMLERGRFMYRPRNEPRFYGGATPFIQTGDVVRSAGYIRKFSQTLNEQGVAISRVFRAGTILITIAANIGYSGVLEFNAACPDSLVAISPSEKLSNLYLNYYLQTQQPKMDQAAPKGTQKNINIQFLSPWPVPIPPHDEQHEIVAILDALDRKITLHRQKRAVLEELFQSLLHKLMTGEIRVADLNLLDLRGK
jgi:type I restriction enzyme S subunit